MEIHIIIQWKGRCDVLTKLQQIVQQLVKRSMQWWQFVIVYYFRKIFLYFRQRERVYCVLCIRFFFLKAIYIKWITLCCGWSCCLEVHFCYFVAKSEKSSCWKILFFLNGLTKTVCVVMFVFCRVITVFFMSQPTLSKMWMGGYKGHTHTHRQFFDVALMAYPLSETLTFI